MTDSREQSPLRGFSLIELMISLLISILSLIAGLTMYRNLVDTAVESRTDSAHDGQISSAMLSLQLRAQAAGFGIDGAGSDQIHLNSSGDRLVWRYLESGNHVCRGFEIVTDNAGALNLYEVETSCNASTTLSDSSLSWNKTSLLARFVRNIPDVSLELVQVNCSPYGMSDPESRYALKVTLENSIRRGIDGNTNMDVDLTEYRICLPNLRT